jgi:hypothetical protein
VAALLPKALGISAYADAMDATIMVALIRVCIIL